MRTTYRVLLVLFVIASIIACTKVPITGRRQMRLLPESDLIGMSMQQYQGFLDTSRVLPASDRRVQMVRTIGTRIQASVEKFMKDNQLEKRIQGFQWEFNVVDDPMVNAWCMPGGKVVVYTGILPVTEDETSLAVVMGHEIAHAVAHHGNERMSQGLLINAAGATLGAVMSDQPSLGRDIFLQSYGIGSTLGMLAYSRNHESEADKLGLVFMAMAGYNPEASIGFWQRMSQAGGAAPPELLSTHPSDETRVQTLREFMPEALKYYKKP
jgi:predicted Zn-dependent protease